MEFVLGTKMDGMTVRNNNNDDLGTITDMVIERGSGRIDYVVMKSGSVLGIGGKHVAVPYESFGWNNDKHEPMLTATKDEIKGWPEFDKSQWSDHKSDHALSRTLGKRHYSNTDNTWPNDAAGAKGGSTEITGTVKSINRNTVNGREELVAVVTPANGQDTEVILGPSWYTMGNNSIGIYRGAPIDVTVFHITRDGRDVAVARSAKINDQSMNFYTTEGHPAWSTDTSTSQTGSMSTPQILFSDIKGKTVDCRGEKCGKVKDIVVECISGKAAFLSIDPDQAFLGVGDQNRMVPWSLLSWTDDRVHLDASKTMITSAPATPGDVRTLGTNADYQRVYSAYDVPPARFEKSSRGADRSR